MKKWYQSKTMWANIIALVIAIIGVVVDSPMLPRDVVLVLTSIVLPVLNVILRSVTSEKITL